MNKKTVLVFLSALFQLSLQVTDVKDDYYKAAVVEFASNRKQEQNIKDYGWFIKQAKQEVELIVKGQKSRFGGMKRKVKQVRFVRVCSVGGELVDFLIEDRHWNVDIIVFPENSIHGYDGDIERKMAEIPEPEDKIVPCRNGDYEQWSALETMSCAAQENTIYVVVNLLERVPCNVSSPDCPAEGRLVYNTVVVFNRNGAVISRYRKFNLHEELIVRTTDEPEFEIFDTDFGVRFGVFTSFDILFKTPSVDLVEKYNITNFVHPSYWYGELPFLTAIQIQSGWSYAMNVNLLAAGASRPVTGAGGSGIFIGRKGPPISSMPDREASTALISQVPKNVRTTSGFSQEAYPSSMIALEKNGDDNAPKSRLLLKKDPTLSQFQSAVLREDETEFRDEICSGRTLCCRFKLSYKKNDEAKDKTYSYRVVAYQGDKPFTREVSGAVEACAVILCTGPELKDCGTQPNPSSEYLYIFKKISIEASFSTNQTVQMPNILLGKGVPSRKTKMVLLGSGHYDFTSKEEENTRTVKMLLKDEARNIITFGIYSRDFSKSEATALYHTLCLPVVVLFFVKYF